MTSILPVFKFYLGYGQQAPNPIKASIIWRCEKKMSYSSLQMQYEMANNVMSCSCATVSGQNKRSHTHIPIGVFRTPHYASDLSLFT